jgi:hypothetical protein
MSQSTSPRVNMSSVRRQLDRQKEQKRIADEAAAKIASDTALQDANTAVDSAGKNVAAVSARRKKRDPREGTLLVAGIKDPSLVANAFGGKKTLLGE